MPVLALAVALAQPPAPPSEAPLDWKTLEAPYLTNHVQLTSRDQFTKAGEAYFSPNDGWIIFQATAVPEPGKEPEPFYSMFVARLTRNEGGRITGIEKPIRVSPDNSANTCGWFDPSLPGSVIFGSTLKTPADEKKSGFQVGTRKYVWMFPNEMEVCRRSVIQMLSIQTESGKDADSSAAAIGVLRQEIAGLRAKLDGANAVPAGMSPRRAELATRLELLNLDLKQIEELAPNEGAATPIFTRPNYDAECSVSPDGRFILYAHVEDTKEGERPDANIYIYDTQTKKHHPIVVAPGYDGGPFFSPDGKRICYRSDREGNDLLQIYVADLKFEDGVPVGIDFEYQLTDNKSVNWAPYWHPSGAYIVYGTSQVSHANYEIFAVRLDEAAMASAKAAAKKANTSHADIPNLLYTRITNATGADVLPVFTKGGDTMMWTSQRGPKVAGEEKPSSQLWIATVGTLPTGKPAAEAGK
ncbi:MAG: PD40 domain-containing protein [Planctomycetes bacterium]|nr:PD40 domain-containing protein [Planctomycetota bacterium]